MRIRRRRPGESLATLHQDIRRLMALAHPKLSSEGRETFACDYLIDAMDDVELALKVREQTPASLDDALRISQQLEAWAKDARRGRHDDVTQPSRRCEVLVTLMVMRNSSATVWNAWKVTFVVCTGYSV